VNPGSREAVDTVKVDYGGGLGMEWSEKELDKIREIRNRPQAERPRIPILPVNPKGRGSDGGIRINVAARVALEEYAASNGLTFKHYSGIVSAAVLDYLGMGWMEENDVANHI
jgi:hypothetical protein